VITRFDHCVVSARDLDSAIETFQRLGFDVRRGGRHTGLGTHNALIRFGLDYLELLAVFDASEAARSGGSGAAMIEYLRDRSGGLLGFAVASSNVDEEYRRGYAEVPPFGMQRARPDGHVLSWRLLVPGQHTWGRPWPFLIQWETPDAQRLEWDGVGEHANGVTGVAGLTVAARDLDGLNRLYSDQLGLRPVRGRVELPDGRTIEVTQSEDEGLVDLHLRTRDLTATRQWFDSRGIETVDLGPEQFGLAPAKSLGAQLVFVR
jgi:Glyoxalase-like domain